MNSKILLDIGKSEAGIILDSEVGLLKNALTMKSTVRDSFLCVYNNPPFKGQLDKKCSEHKKVYFVIKNIDEANLEQQSRFFSMVKDREFLGYKIPDNCVILFTVSGEDTLNKISRNLYRCCRNAIK